MDPSHPDVTKHIVLDGQSLNIDQVVHVAHQPQTSIKLGFQARK